MDLMNRKHPYYFPHSLYSVDRYFKTDTVLEKISGPFRKIYKERNY